MGSFMSHGDAVCTPRQQQELPQQLQQEAEEKADVVYMSAHFAISRTIASRVHPTWGLLRGATPCGITAACILLLENGRGVIVGCLKQYQKRWGLVRMAIKSSGVAARTPWQAEATAAEGEVTEGSDLGVSSVGSFLVRQHIAGVGFRPGHRGCGFCRNE